MSGGPERSGGARGGRDDLPAPRVERYDRQLRLALRIAAVGVLLGVALPALSLGPEGEVVARWWRTESTPAGEGAEAPFPVTVALVAGAGLLGLALSGWGRLKRRGLLLTLGLAVLLAWLSAGWGWPRSGIPWVGASALLSSAPPLVATWLEATGAQRRAARWAAGLAALVGLGPLILPLTPGYPWGHVLTGIAKVGSEKPGEAALGVSLTLWVALMVVLGVLALARGRSRARGWVLAGLLVALLAADARVRWLALARAQDDARTRLPAWGRALEATRDLTAAWGLPCLLSLSLSAWIVGQRWEPRGARGAPAGRGERHRRLVGPFVAGTPGAAGDGEAGQG